MYVPGGLISRNRSGRKASRIGIDLRVAVQQVGVGGQRHAGRVADAADLDRLLDQAGLGVRQHRAAAQDLVDGRRQVGSSILVVSSPRPDAVSRRLAASRANAHASCEAVVSCPATSAVISSSRSSIRAHRRAVVVLGGQQQRERVSATSEPSRGVPRSAQRSARSACALAVLGGRPVRARPSTCGIGTNDTGLSVNARSSVNSSRRASSWAPCSSPNTARRTISSVRPCSRGCSSIV